MECGETAAQEIVVNLVPHRFVCGESLGGPVAVRQYRAALSGQRLPVGIFAAMGEEVLQLLRVHTLLTAAVLRGTFGLHAGGHKVLQSLLLAGLLRYDPVPVEAGLGEDGQPVCGVGHRNRITLLAKIGQNMLCGIEELRTLLILLFDGGKGKRVLLLEQVVRIVQH